MPTIYGSKGKLASVCFMLQHASQVSVKIKINAFKLLCFSGRNKNMTTQCDEDSLMVLSYIFNVVYIIISIKILCSLAHSFFLLAKRQLSLKFLNKTQTFCVVSVICKYIA